MSDIRIFDNVDLLAKAAAEQAVNTLNTAIDANGTATWVVAGGSTPVPAYKVIAKGYEDKVDWSKVTIIMGDERIGALDGPDNNWQAVDNIIGKLPTKKLRPLSDRSAEHAAEDYSMQLASLPKIENGLPRFDLVWLGVGPDGHTLSIFPGHASLHPTGNLVIPVHDSPKPPTDRISLSLRGLLGASTVVIIVTGAEKKQVVATNQVNGQMPIGLAVTIVETHGGKVHWLVDSAAATD